MKSVASYRRKALKKPGIRADYERLGPLIPNDETIAAMKAAERGELVAVKSVDELLSNLNADD